MRDRTELEEQRDLRLRDLLELDARLAAGELTPEDAARLRARDERAALEAMAALDEFADVETDPPATDTPPARSRRRRLGTLAGVLVLLAAVGGTLAGAITDRPMGGFVTGNELSATDEMPPARADVPIEALEEVVAANPEVVGMRLALADRLFAEGRYAEAGEHYLEVLQREPEPRVMARLAWLAAGDGNVEVAIQLADVALELAPEEPEALWVRADLAVAAGDDDRARRLYERLAAHPALDAASREEIEARLQAFDLSEDGS